MTDVQLLLNAARLAAAVNVVLLAALIALWGQLYREVSSKLTLGSIVFAGFLLAENAVALWFYFNAPSMPGIAVEVMMVLQILETFGIATLLYVTWQ
jgi:hydrogenase-4 membrane subunit HyfE